MGEEVVVRWVCNIHQPLERRQRANHGDPNRQAVPQSRKSNVAVYPPHCFSGTFARCITHISNSCPVKPDTPKEDSPFRSLFNLLTITSAGWLTTAQAIPAI